MSNKKWNIETPIEFFYDGDHYTIDGEKYYRVTRIKSVINQPGLNMWRAKYGIKKSNEIMRESGNFGSKFHKLCQIILEGHPVDASKYGEEMEETVASFVKFIADFNIEMEKSEQSLWVDSLKVGGTTDFIGYADLPKLGKSMHVIGDWKTSSGIYEDYWLQIAAYVFMFEEMTKISLDGAFIVQFKNGKTTLAEKTYEELKKYFEVFKHCIEIFRYTKGEF
jgi:hypothetical protein